MDQSKGNFPHLFSNPALETHKWLNGIHEVPTIQNSLPSWYITLIEQLPAGKLANSRSPLQRVLLSNDNRDWINKSVVEVLKQKTGKHMDVHSNPNNAAILENLLNDAYEHSNEPQIGRSPTAYHQAIRNEILRLNTLVVDTLVEAVLFDINQAKPPMFQVMNLPTKETRETVHEMNWI
jgi:hypothetical protein